jgi:hypothetical protein
MHRFVATVVVCCSFFVFGIICVTAQSLNETAQTIEGYVIATEWNDDEEVVAIAIRVNDVSENEDGILTAPDDYYVVENEKAMELIELVDEMVVATGTIKIDETGNKTILVTSYRIIISDEDENEEDVEPEEEPSR